MARTFQVDLETTASAVMTVTLTDEQLQEIAAQQGVENISDLTLDMLAEAAQKEALNEAPTLCASTEVGDGTKHWT